MKRFVIILFVYCCAQFSLHGQDIVASAGISQASMNDLKRLQEYLVVEFPVEFRNTQSFPPYFQYNITTTFSGSEKFRWGLRAYTTSTGARSVYADYSGEVRVDQTVSCIGIALHSELILKKFNRSELAMVLEVGHILTHLTVDGYFRLGNSPAETFNEKFKSANRMFETGLCYRYLLNDRLFLFTQVGVQGNVTGDLQSRSDGSSLDDFSADWSGFKAFMGMGLRFKKGN